jgi:L-lactate permease
MYMTAAAFIILLLLGLLAVWLYAEIARFPGRKAHERGHTYADAVEVLGWIGPFLAGVGWVVALVWAYATPVHAGGGVHRPERKHS